MLRISNHYGHILVALTIALLTISAAAGQDATSSPTDTSTPDPFIPVTHNADWSPVTQTINSLDVMLVPAGSFLLGSTSDQLETPLQQCEAVHGQRTGCPQWFEVESPPTEIRLANPFWITRTEVTNAQYAECMEAGACAPPSYLTYFDDPAYADHPVVYVDWYQANDYASWWGGWLPTEAEWEYAARGPDDLLYPWGNTFDGTRLNSCDTNCAEIERDPNVNDGYARTAPVGTYLAGASWIGALDMSGNVWEWVSSAFEPYPYNAGDGREDVTPTYAPRVLRGGSWNNSTFVLRAATRVRDTPVLRNIVFGFRCVRSY